MIARSNSSRWITVGLFTATLFTVLLLYLLLPNEISGQDSDQQPLEQLILDDGSIGREEGDTPNLNASPYIVVGAGSFIPDGVYSDGIYYIDS